MSLANSRKRAMSPSRVAARCWAASTHSAPAPVGGQRPGAVKRLAGRLVTPPRRRVPPRRRPRLQPRPCVFQRRFGRVLLSASFLRFHFAGGKRVLAHARGGLVSQRFVDQLRLKG